MRAQRDKDLSDELHQVKCPVLIVHGDSDTTVPFAFGEALATLISEATLARFVGVGHGLIVDQQAQSVSTDWLRKTV